MGGDGGVCVFRGQCRLSSFNGGFEMSDEKERVLIKNTSLPDGVYEVDSSALLRSAADPSKGMPGNPYVNENGKLIPLVECLDAKIWAEEFMKTYKFLIENGQDDLDEGLMLGWFANAIMSGHDHATRRERAATGVLLRRIAGMCGNPNAGDGCREILKFIRESGYGA